MQINIDSVVIILADEQGVVTIIERNHQRQWKVNGILYPRFVNLMQYIDDMDRNKKN